MHTRPVTRLAPLVTAGVALILLGCGSNDTYSPTVIGSDLHPDFIITVSPDTKKAIADYSDKSRSKFAVTVKSVDGFSDQVKLSVTSTGPANLGVLTLAQSAVTPTPTGAMTELYAGAGLEPGSPPGVYTITVKGTSGAKQRTDTVTLTLTGFSVAVSPSQATLVTGGTTVYQVTVTPLPSEDPFVGEVTLSLLNLNDAVIRSLVPSSVQFTGAATPATSELSLSYPEGSLSGDFNMVVRGVGAPYRASAGAVLRLNPPGDLEGTIR